MSFQSELREWVRVTEVRNAAVFLGVVAEVHRSIKVGSDITGAPGQPVQTGNLRNSWQAVNEGPGQATVGTNVVYAGPIEDGVHPKTGRPLTLRSATGGFNSVAKTIAGYDRIVEHVTRVVTGGDP